VTQRGEVTRAIRVVLEEKRVEIGKPMERVAGNRLVAAAG
jgi:hypothetical protein